MQEASYYRKTGQDQLQCDLCPHHCRLTLNETGRCKVRTNIDNKLIAKSTGHISALHSDPVEKKPLYHFYPGMKILSVGSYGCNMQCSFCQNWEISQCFPEPDIAFRKMSSDDIINTACNTPDNAGIAFTYNEPVVNFEFVAETALKAKAAGLHTAFITNGFISQKPLQQLLACIDAFNVDLKVWSDPLYKSYTGGRLAPVLRTLKSIRSSGKHLEITHLVVTGMNDKTKLFDQMTDWINKELGELSVLHISRYFPGHRLSNAPTSSALLSYMYDKAREKLPYTYIGNMMLPGASDTFCHQCQKKVIERQAYHTRIIGLNTKGECIECGNKILNHINH